MSAFLSPVLPLGFDETPTSYVSRLAYFHRAPSAKEFCRELGMSLKGISYANPTMLEWLARITGASLASFEANSFRPVREGGTRRDRIFRGERLRVTCLRYNGIRVCLHCLDEDRRASPELGECAPYGRSIWDLSAIRTCPLHRTKLAHIDFKATSTTDRHTRNDFHAIRQKFDGKPDSDSTGPSSLETYLLHRLTHGRKTEFWLDTLPYYGAVKACRIFGCVARFGPQQVLRQLTEDDWHVAASSGFDILKDGESGIHWFLEHLQSTYGHNRSSNRYSAYGLIYRWLMFEMGDQSYSGLRGIVQDHFTKKLGFGLGRGVFGNTASERTVLSIRAASLAYRLEPRRLRRILEMQGLIGADHASRPDDMVTFDAASAKSLLNDVQTSLSLGAVANYIGSTRRDVEVLERAGHLVPICRGGQRDSALSVYIFRRRDVDAFLERLNAPAANPRPTSARFLTLHEAQIRLRCGKPAIVDLILSGQVRWVGYMDERRTYNTLLIDFDEIEHLLRGRFIDVTPLGQAARQLGVTLNHAWLLAKLGHLCCETHHHPVNRRSMVTVRNDSLREFANTYISLRNLCRQKNRFVVFISRQLKMVDCKPVLLSAEGPAAFYDKKDAQFALRSLTDKPSRSDRDIPESSIPIAIT